LGSFLIDRKGVRSYEVFFLENCIFPGSAIPFVLETKPSLNGPNL
jgi:hypothetical protein